MKTYAQFIVEADEQPSLLDNLADAPECDDITRQAIEASKEADKGNPKEGATRVAHSVAEGKHRAAATHHQNAGHPELADLHREQAKIHWAVNGPIKHKPRRNISRAQYRQGRR